MSEEEEIEFSRDTRTEGDRRNNSRETTEVQRQPNNNNSLSSSNSTSMTMAGLQKSNHSKGKDPRVGAHSVAQRAYGDLPAWVREQNRNQRQAQIARSAGNYTSNSGNAPTPHNSGFFNERTETPSASSGHFDLSAIPPELRADAQRNMNSVQVDLSNIPPELRPQLSNIPPELRADALMNLSAGHLSLSSIPPELRPDLSDIPPELRADALMNLSSGQLSNPSIPPELRPQTPASSGHFDVSSVPPELRSEAFMNSGHFSLSSVPPEIRPEAGMNSGHFEESMVSSDGFLIAQVTPADNNASDTGDKNQAKAKKRPLLEWFQNLLGGTKSLEGTQKTQAHISSELNQSGETLGTSPSSESSRTERKGTGKLLLVVLGLAVLAVLAGIVGFVVARNSAAPAEKSRIYQVVEPLVGDANVLASEASPEGRAFRWISSEDPLGLVNATGVPDWRLAQRFSLALLYFSTGGETSWKEQHEFLSEKAECEWYSSVFGAERVERAGVARCSREGRVEDLRLPRNKLSGSLPWAALATALPNMKTISLGGNTLGGSLPTELASLTSLGVLELSRCDLSGVLPVEWAALTGLRGLRLSENRVSGSLPSALSRWTMIESIELGWNELTGTLPDSYEAWDGLVEVGFENNRLTGTLPDSYGAWTNLVTANFQGNELTGTLPDSYLLQWTDLEEAWFDDNEFAEPFPPPYQNYTLM